MAAQMMETDLRLEGMGHDLLSEWCRWARDDHNGDGEGVGYLRERLDKPYWGNPPDEYWVVDKIVAPHRRDKSNYWLCVSRYYLGERALWEISKELGYHWPEKRVLMNLVAFGALVEREYVDVLEASRVKSRPQSAPKLRLQ